MAIEKESSVAFVSFRTRRSHNVDSIPEVVDLGESLLKLGERFPTSDPA